MRWQGSELILEAGQIHAVAENDEYRMQAPWDDDQPFTAPIVCGVKTVNAFTSVLEAINVDTDVSMIQTAWRAVPCTHLPNRYISVELSSQLQHDKWQETIAVSKFLNTQKTSSPVTRVYIEITDENEYQILDGSRCKVHGLPTIPIRSSSAISDTVKMLDHIAKFKHIERLENRVPNPEFEQHIKIDLADSKGHATYSTGNLHVKHGEILELRCLNLSGKPAYLSVIDLTPLWGIDNILRKKYGDYKDLVPTRSSSLPYVADTTPLKVRMTIPKVLEHMSECSDVIKIFVTSRPVSISSLCLPALASRDQVVESVRRSSELNLMNLLEHLSPTTRGSGNTMIDECWLTRNFVIHVSK